MGKKKRRKMVRAEEEEEEEKVSPLPSPNDDGILSSSRNPITPIFHSILAAISPTGQCSDRAHRDFRCDEPFH